MREPEKFIKYCREEKEMQNKIKKMMRVSDRVRLTILRKSLKMKEDDFFAKIFEWADNFGFRINGDYLYVKKKSSSEFKEVVNNDKKKNQDMLK